MAHTASHWEFTHFQWTELRHAALNVRIPKDPKAKEKHKLDEQKNTESLVTFFSLFSLPPSFHLFHFIRFHSIWINLYYLKFGKVIEWKVESRNWKFVHVFFLRILYGICDAIVKLGVQVMLELSLLLIIDQYLNNRNDFWFKSTIVMHVCVHVRACRPKLI